MSQITIAVRSSNLADTPVEFVVEGEEVKAKHAVGAEATMWGNTDRTRHIVTVGRETEGENQGSPRIAVCLQPSTAEGEVKRTVKQAVDQLKQAFGMYGIFVPQPAERDIIASEPCSYTSLEDQADQGLPYREP